MGSSAAERAVTVASSRAAILLCSLILNFLKLNDISFQGPEQVTVAWGHAAAGVQ